MKRALNDDAQMMSSLRPPGGETAAPEPGDHVMSRWRGLREMLIRQLDMFESGGLTLRANNADISASAIADLKRSILEFDALISADGPRGDA